MLGYTPPRRRRTGTVEPPTGIGTLLLSNNINNSNAQQLWVYYTADPVPSDLTGLPRQVYSIAGTVGTVRNLSAFYQLHGAGNYVIAVREPSRSTLRGGDDGYVLYPTSSTPSGIISTDTVYTYDPVNLPDSYSTSLLYATISEAEAIAQFLIDWFN